MPSGTDGNNLSQEAYWLIGGQIQHAIGMTLIANPTVNSYKRLNAGHRAPRYATWARVSQASLIRVPSWLDTDQAEIELRSPDPMANPYLAFAVALASGMDGIRQRTDAGDPFDESFVTFDDAEFLRQGRYPVAIDARRGDFGVRGRRSCDAGARQLHLRSVDLGQARRMGGVPRPCQPVGT